MTEVVNINHVRHDEWDVYIGRKNDGVYHMNSVDVGEPGWLGNPYKLSENTRSEAIQKYRRAFYKRLDEDPDFKEAVEELRGKTLACHCKPKDCHGDVIREYLSKGVFDF